MSGEARAASEVPVATPATAVAPDAESRVEPWPLLKQLVETRLAMVQYAGMRHFPMVTAFTGPIKDAYFGCQKTLAYFQAIQEPSDRKKYLGPALQGFVRASLDYGLHVVDAEMEVPVEKPSHLDWFRALADDHYGVLAAVAGILSPPPGKAVSLTEALIGALTLDLTDVLLYRTAELSYAFVVSRLEKSVTVQEIKDLPTERVQLLLWDGIGPRLNVIPEHLFRAVGLFMLLTRGSSGSFENRNSRNSASMELVEKGLRDSAHLLAIMYAGKLLYWAWCHYDLFAPGLPACDVQDLFNFSVPQAPVPADAAQDLPEYLAWMVAQRELSRYMGGDPMCANDGCSKRAPNLQRCGSCRIPSYCSRECQKAAWRDHRAVCSLCTTRRRVCDGRDGVAAVCRKLLTLYVTAIRSTPGLDLWSTTDADYILTVVPPESNAGASTSATATASGIGEEKPHGAEAGNKSAPTTTSTTSTTSSTNDAAGSAGSESQNLRRCVRLLAAGQPEVAYMRLLPVLHLNPSNLAAYALRITAISQRPSLVLSAAGGALAAAAMVETMRKVSLEDPQAADSAVDTLQAYADAALAQCATDGDGSYRKPSPEATLAASGKSAKAADTVAVVKVATDAVVACLAIASAAAPNATSNQGSSQGSSNALTKEIDGSANGKSSITPTTPAVAAGAATAGGAAAASATTQEKTAKTSASMPELSVSQARTKLEAAVCLAAAALIVEVTRDPEHATQARKLYYRAFGLGSMFAGVRLARWWAHDENLGTGALMRSAAVLRPLADAGYAPAQTCMAVMALTGYGAPVSLDVCEKYAGLAATQCDADAMVILAFIREGLQREEWRQAAESRGHPRITLQREPGRAEMLSLAGSLTLAISRRFPLNIVGPVDL